MMKCISSDWFANFYGLKTSDASQMMGMLPNYILEMVQLFLLLHFVSSQFYTLLLFSTILHT